MIKEIYNAWKFADFMGLPFKWKLGAIWWILKCRR